MTTTERQTLELEIAVADAAAELSETPRQRSNRKKVERECRNLTELAQEYDKAASRADTLEEKLILLKASKALGEARRAVRRATFPFIDFGA